MNKTNIKLKNIKFNYMNPVVKINTNKNKMYIITLCAVERLKLEK